MKNKYKICVSAFLILFALVLVGCGKDDGTSDVESGTGSAVTAGSYQISDTEAPDKTAPVESGNLQSGSDNPDVPSLNGDTDVTKKEPDTSDGKPEKTEKTPSVTDAETETAEITTPLLIQVLPDGGLLLPDDEWE